MSFVPVFMKSEPVGAAEVLGVDPSPSGFEVRVRVGRMILHANRLPQHEGMLNPLRHEPPWKLTVGEYEGLTFLSWKSGFMKDNVHILEDVVLEGTRAG